MLPQDGGDAEAALGRFTQAGVDLEALAAELQREGAAAFVKSWQDLLACIEPTRARGPGRPADDGDQRADAERSTWKALRRHAEEMRSAHLRGLFADDPGRGERYTAEAAGLYLDYSKHRVTDETLRLLLALAEESGLPARIEAMFRGDKINGTEHRAVLHTALRAQRSRSIVVDGQDVVPKVHAVLNRMANFARRMRAAAGQDIRASESATSSTSASAAPISVPSWRTKRSVTTATERSPSASSRTSTAPTWSRRRATSTPPRRSSSSRRRRFTTLETMTNAASARAWTLATLRDEKAVARQLVAVSTNAEEVARFGIDTANMVEFWDRVGGTYSMDSAIGLSTMIAVGSEYFHNMLASFHAMDEHFRTALLARNLPALMGLLAVWYGEFFGDDRGSALRPVPEEASPPTSSSSRWSRTASTSRSTAGPSTARRERSTGASPGRTASTPSTS